MENIHRLFWAGAVIAALFFTSGIVVSIIAGFEPILLFACLFSAVGVWAALRGARRADIAWWAGGILLTGFITPTVWGLVPMITALLLVLTGSLLAWQEHRRGSL